MNATALHIQNSGDLSQRIPVNSSGDELAQLAENYNRAFDRLERNFQAEQQFTSNASHELRTPISVILARCEYAQEVLDDPDELSESLDAIRRQGNKMSHLVETLLMFTRLEQQTGRYLKSKINVSEVTAEVCEDYQLLHENDITMTGKIQPNLMLLANRELFSLMVSNLLKNAYRYGRPGGTVTVHLIQEMDTICLEVIDNGIGMTEEEELKIWQRFYRGDASRSSNGLGLGLPMVKQIVEFHRGRIEVRSKLGIGSVFRIQFPVEKEI